MLFFNKGIIRVTFYRHFNGNSFDVPISFYNNEMVVKLSYALVMLTIERPRWNNSKTNKFIGFVRSGWENGFKINAKKTLSSRLGISESEKVILDDEKINQENIFR